MKIELSEKQQRLIQEEINKLKIKMYNEDWGTDPWGRMYLDEHIEELEEILKTNVIEI